MTNSATPIQTTMRRLSELVEFGAWRSIATPEV
jgi:hypothetical protein